MGRFITILRFQLKVASENFITSTNIIEGLSLIDRKSFKNAVFKSLNFIEACALVLEDERV